MEWILGGGLLGALVFIYFVAKSNGRKQAIIEQQDLQITAQANDQEFITKDIQILQNQMFQMQGFRDAIENRLKGVDVRTLPDSTLTELFKDPTIIVEVTDPYSTKLEKGKPTK